MGTDGLTPAGRVTGRPAAPLTAAQQQMVQEKLWLLLSRQTALYTMGDSSSVPMATAEELMQSLRFTLDFYLRTEGLTPSVFVSGNMDALLREGRRCLAAAQEQARRLYNAVLQTPPAPENISYADTLRSIGEGFRRYDARFFAHTFPCDIDYQLAIPVPEALLGIEYVREYLKRVYTENLLLAQFDRQAVLALLAHSCQDYRGLLINLCEPALVNGVGLALLGRDGRSLALTQDDRAQLLALLTPLPRSRVCALLETAADDLCRGLGVTQAYAVQYVRRVAQAVYPRLAATVAAGELTGVFPPLS